MADALIRPLADCARWSLRLPAARAEALGEVAGFCVALPVNRCAGTGARLSARLGPDEWLLCGEGMSETALAGEPHSLVDVGHRYAAFALDAGQAALLLAAGCPLDLHEQGFPPGSATRTLLGKVEIILWRPAGAASWRVECARSYAPYASAFLREAARELG
jgi:sarcosine oxidase subunit gamma